MKGIVKFYNTEKGYGFVKANNIDYFVHIRDIKGMDPNGSLLPGQNVEFEAQTNAKGKTAKNVQVLVA
jgi:CspA family cold shock protein